MLRAIGVAIALSVGLAAPTAAHHSASRQGRLYRERYLVCDHADAATRIDCVGPKQAHASLIKSLALGDLVRNKNLDYWIEPARRGAVWAAYFNIRDAAPALRKWLDIRIAKQDRDDHLMLDKEGLRGEAAYALAHLGDTTSGPAIVSLLVELETDGHGSLWSDTLAALAVLDPARASRYAIDFLSRQTSFATSMPGGSSKLVALDLVLAADADRANPVLAKLATREEHGNDHAHCELMATRVRLDPAVHAKVRELFASDYSGSWLAGCAEAVLQRYGSDPADAETLVRHLGRNDAGMDFGVANLAYERILDLELVLAARHDAAADAARDVLRRGLTERSAWPHVADPSHRSYSLHYVALHSAALAGLGDAAAAKRLAALVDDPKDTTGVAWLASLHELRLGLPHAVDRAAALMVRGTKYSNSIDHGLFEGIRSRVLDAFVARAPEDGRWAVMLLDGDARSDAQEHALELLARRTPKRACEAVTAAARGVKSAAAELAFLALSTQGEACFPALEALADAHDAPSEIRGAAVELLAAFDAPKLCAHLRVAYGDNVSAAALERAQQLRHPTCGAAPKRN